MIPEVRLRRANAAPEDPSGDYVLYWMIAARRLADSHALDHALDRARALRRPLLVLEALRCDHRWACDRIHRFVLDGMRDKAAPLAAAGIGSYPYVEPAPGAGRGLLLALARRACLVVTDDSPAFFLPRMVAAAAAQVPVALHAVDGNGLVPLASTAREFPTAYAFRRFLQKELPARFADAPTHEPLRDAAIPPFGPLPRDVAERWPPAPASLLEGGDLGALPIDHGVAPTGAIGGEREGSRRLQAFMKDGIDRYEQSRNDPDADATSGLSPWLHFGHVSPWAVLRELSRREGWSPAEVAKRADGQREGWWGVSRSAEAFLDELVTWRELGAVFAHHRPDHDRYETLPDWALATLEEHARDPRPHVYGKDAFEEARTHDPLWNAAQTQLVREGRIHNMLRMLWGKKVLEWSASPQEAFATLFELNDRYALDGRDPNSSSGITWIFGRFDRPWPSRPIYGSVRSMSSEATARKVSVRRYLAAWGAPAGPLFS